MLKGYVTWIPIFHDLFFCFLIAHHNQKTPSIIFLPHMRDCNLFFFFFSHFLCKMNCYFGSLLFDGKIKITRTTVMIEMDCTVISCLILSAGNIQPLMDQSSLFLLPTDLKKGEKQDISCCVYKKGSQLTIRELKTRSKGRIVEMMFHTRCNKVGKGFSLDAKDQPSVVQLGVAL